jgi:hypothetical protein
MAMRMLAAPIPFAGSRLGEIRRVCAFFNSADEEYRVLLPFIQDGYARGHRAVHVVRPDQRGDHLRRLAEAGVDRAAAERSGQLELRGAPENPFYAPPQEFLREYRHGREGRTAAPSPLA